MKAQRNSLNLLIALILAFSLAAPARPVASVSAAQADLPPVNGPFPPAVTAPSGLGWGLSTSLPALPADTAQAVIQPSGQEFYEVLPTPALPRGVEETYLVFNPIRQEGGFTDPADPPRKSDPAPAGTRAAGPDGAVLPGTWAVMMSEDFSGSLPARGWQVYDSPFVDDTALYTDLPDLLPNQPVGWEFPVVPASIPDTTLTNPLFTHLNTYVDYAILNQGTAISSPFQSCLYLDEQQFFCRTLYDIR